MSEINRSRYFFFFTNPLFDMLHAFLFFYLKKKKSLFDMYTTDIIKKFNNQYKHKEDLKEKRKLRTLLPSCLFESIQKKKKISNNTLSFKCTDFLLLMI